ncbi:DotU family type IV/VI secretion system protein (plasmid) [Enterobacteriaceae bacterium Kacie_13]|nr:DotU family type IV/VI secretion system protein [Enterobacteriaceae bacterium Kacie_13]
MKLLDCYLPVFKLAAEFAHQPALFADYDTFRALCLTRLEAAVQEAEYQDVTDFERDQAFFAVVVWLDETVLCSAQPFAQSWRYDLLQRKYFQTSIGGEMFFVRLNDLKEEHLQARRVFLFCLQNGFHGKYSAAQDTHALAVLIGQQRQHCLPQAWQQWPNDAQLTPVSVRKRSLASSKCNVVLAVLGLAVLYATLVLLQTLYFS